MWLELSHLHTNVYHPHPISQVTNGKTETEKYSNPPTASQQVNIEAGSDCKACLPCHVASIVVSTSQFILSSHYSFPGVDRGGQGSGR